MQAADGTAVALRGIFQSHLIARNYLSKWFRNLLEFEVFEILPVEHPSARARENLARCLRNLEALDDDDDVDGHGTA